MSNSVAVEMEIDVECDECGEEMIASFSFGTLRVERCDNCSKPFGDDDEETTNS